MTALLPVSPDIVIWTPDVERRLKVGLALGGGAVKGLAHVTVLDTLVRAGIPIDCVAGTSVGSLIGALFCGGLPTSRLIEFAQWVGWRHLSTPTWPWRGLVSFSRLERFLIATLGDIQFSELTVPFAAIATDMEKGARVVLQTGRVASAVRASCSVPGIVEPIRLEGRLLADGGITDNLPADAARALGADFVIGVNVLGMAPTPRKRLDPLWPAMAAAETMVRNAGGGVSSVDCLVSPATEGLSYSDFTDRQRLLDVGREAAVAKLSEIEQALANRQASKSASRPTPWPSAAIS